MYLADGICNKQTGLYPLSRCHMTFAFDKANNGKRYMSHCHDFIVQCTKIYKTKSVVIHNLSNARIYVRFCMEIVHTTSFLLHLAFGRRSKS
jgi:hypothetical protein